MPTKVRNVKSADRFKVSLSFVRNLLRHYRQTGTVKPKTHGGGAITKITGSNLPIVEQLIRQQPDAIRKRVV